MAHPTDNGYQSLLSAAQAHGNQSEPDHEVGDLQDVVMAAWAVMSPEQRAKVTEECSDILDWLD